MVDARSGRRKRKRTREQCVDELGHDGNAGSPVPDVTLSIPFVQRRATRMSDFDLVIRGGTVATASEVFEADVGVSGERIAALGPSLARAAGARSTRAASSCCPAASTATATSSSSRRSGIMCADDFYTATVSAAFGGTTTVISFCAQHRGDAIPAVLADYAERARAKAVIDYAFHLIVANPDEATLQARSARRDRAGHPLVQDLHDLRPPAPHRRADPRRDGGRAQARRARHGARREPRRDLVARRAHARAGQRRAALPRASATRAASEPRRSSASPMLAELIDVPILIVHVSTVDGIEAIRQARARGVKIYGETCPQYLFLTAKDLDRPGLEGAMFCCSPPPRDEAAQQACWRGLAGRRAERVLVRPRALPLRRDRQAARRASRRRSRRWRTACRASSCGCRCFSRSATAPGASRCRSSSR